MVKVYIKNKFGVKREYIDFETVEQANNFCEALNWQLKDMNGFVWHMWYEEL